MSKKKMFDFCIGNPPYQDTTDSDSTRMPPVYNQFMDESYNVACAVELITPARFLFNAGYTPKTWNEKILHDVHFKILEYEPDCTKIFPNTDIKGGLAVSYRDESHNYGAIEIFTKYPELNCILMKVKNVCNKYLNSIILSPLSYSLSEKMKAENPNTVGRLMILATSGQRSYNIRTSIPEISGHGFL